MLVTYTSPITLTQCKSHGGFTLIELSVVLVIIGLVIGGIMVGQDMIKHATLRHDISMEQQYVSAINTFRIKYNCLPGDCARASDFLPGATNGDGNGQIDGLQGWYANWDWAPTSEIAILNDHLARANLIPLPPIPSWDPSYNLPGIGWLNLSCSMCALLAYSYQGVNFVVIGGGSFPPPGNHVVYVAGYNNNYTPIEASYIDSKVDDGLPESGNVQAWAGPIVSIDGGNGQPMNSGGCQSWGADGGTWTNQYNITYHYTAWNNPGSTIPRGPCSLIFLNAF